MYRKWLLVAGVLDLFILSLLDKVAFHYYLYWRFFWFDILMHLIGGVAIGLVSSYVYWERQKEKQLNNTNQVAESLPSQRGFYLFNLSFILLAGVSWEIFEVWADRIVRFKIFDTVSDLSFGIIGSLSIGLFVLWIHQRNLRKLK